MPDSLHKEAAWLYKLAVDSWFWLAGLVTTLCGALYWLLSRRVDRCAGIKELDELKKEIEKIWEKVSETGENVAYMKGKMEGKHKKEGGINENRKVRN